MCEPPLLLQVGVSALCNDDADSRPLWPADAHAAIPVLMHIAHVTVTEALLQSVIDRELGGTGMEDSAEQVMAAGRLLRLLAGSWMPGEREGGPRRAGPVNCQDAWVTERLMAGLRRAGSILAWVLAGCLPGCTAATAFFEYLPVLACLSFSDRAPRCPPPFPPLC